MQAEWLSETEAAMLAAATSEVCRAQGLLATAARCWRQGHIRDAREHLAMALERVRIAEQSIVDAEPLCEATLLMGYSG